MGTDAFENFKYGLTRLDALYIHILEESAEYKQEIKDLVKELILIQLVALIEGYKDELSRFLILKQLNQVYKNRRIRSRAIQILGNTQTSADWENVYEEIILVAVDDLKRGAYEDWISKVKNDYLPAISLNRDNPLMLKFIEFIATRNIIAHQQGRITESYLNRTCLFYSHFSSLVPPQIGESRSLDDAYCKEAMNCFFNVIDQIDVEAINFLV